MDRTPPSADVLLDLLRRTMATEYWSAVEQDPPLLGIYRAMAEVFAVLGRRIYKASQAGYYLPWSETGEEPATFARRSTFEVDLYRETLRDAGVTMDRVWLKGPQGRRYYNVDPIVWAPNGATTQRVTFEAQYPGWVFDLDFLADEDGLLTEPQSDPRVPWTSRVGWIPESTRAGNDATIEVAGTVITLTDTGSADTLNEDDVGRYVRIIDAANAANRGRIVRLVRHEQGATETPPGSGQYPSVMTLDEAGEAWPLLGAELDDGGVFTTQGATVSLLPAVPAANDAIVFGLHEPFTRLTFDVTTATDGDIKLVWEVWTGAAWVEVAGLDDGTSTFREGGVVSWEMPALWAAVAVNGTVAYWVRARADSATAATGGEAATVIAGVPYQLVDDDSVTWQLLRWQDMGFAITRMTAPTGGRENTLELLGGERKVYRVAGETEDSFRFRAARRADVITPLALHSALNRVLAPFGLRGRVMDVQSDGIGGPGFPGMFYDVPESSFPAMLGAYDLYEPGDPVLPSPYFLPIAGWQTTRHFWVLLPLSNLGDFGFAYDEGPVFTDPEGGFSLGGAYDSAVYDGYAVTVRVIHDVIYQTLRGLKLLGVSMTFMLDPDLNIPC